MNQRNNTVRKTILVALSVSFVCSVFVAASVVGLRSEQEKNKALDVKKNILKAAGFSQDQIRERPEDLFQMYIRPVAIDLDSGEELKEVDPLKVNPVSEARDPKMNEMIPPGQDMAKIRTRSKRSVVYKVERDGKIEQVIFPVYGKGLWSTMYGLVSLSSDLNTVKGITFYEHGETPGLGGEIENPSWQQIWEGKKIYDDSGNVKIQVIKGNVGPSTPDAQHKIDGISGSTLTSRGVSDLFHYWMGQNGYEPYIKKHRGLL